MFGISAGIIGSASGEPFSFGNALQFDGVDDFVNIPTVTELNSTSKATYNFWLKINNTSKRVEIGTAPSSSNGLYVLYIHPNFYTQTRNGSSFSSNIVNINGYNTGWHFFSFVYDGSQTNNNDRVKLYADGNELTYSSIGAVPTSLASNVGTRFSLNALFANYGDFVIDEFSVYDDPLTLNEHQAIYNAGNGEFPSVAIPSKTPIAYWRMNGTAGDTTAIDEQGTYNGTLNNFNTSTCWVPH